MKIRVIDPPAAVTDYRWDMGGEGSFTADTGTVPHASTKFSAPGAHRVLVQVTSGHVLETAAITLTVRPAANIHRARARPASRREGAGGPRLAHVAGDPSDTIADFSFAPKTITIHAGDTITWTNDGPSPHSATANNGSFDTGVLKKGHSGSHTFTQAGTFTYFCTIHPFMHGTVVVLAARTTGRRSTTPTTPATTPRTPTTTSATPTTTSATPTTTSATPTTTRATATDTRSSSAPAAASATSSAQTLPDTGLNVLAALTVGILLLSGGLVLRRRLLR